MENTIQSLEGNFIFTLGLLWIITTVGMFLSILSRDQSIGGIYNYRNKIAIVTSIVAIITIIAQQVYIYLY